MKRLVIAAVLLASPVAASESDDQKAMAILRRDPAQLEAMVTVKGDRLDPNITVTTYGVTKIKTRGFLYSYDDESSFLRGFIDRQTGEVTAQIYHIATYGGTGWNFYRTASLAMPGGLRQVPTTEAGTDVSCQRYGCTHTEEVIIPLSFAELEAKAANFNPAQPFNGIAYRLFGQSGATIDGIVPENELVAFVRVIERNRPAVLSRPAPATVAPQPDRTPIAAPGKTKPAIPQPAAESPSPAPTSPAATKSHLRCITCR